MAKESEIFKSNMESLFSGMDGFLSTKTVVGEPIHLEDTVIIPLVDVSFGCGAGAFSGNVKNGGGGGMGGKMTPSAVLVIHDGMTRLINISTHSGMDKVLDMVPDFVDRFKNRDKSKNKPVFDEETKEAAKEAMEEMIYDAADVELSE